MSWVKDKITIKGKEIPTKIGYLKQSELNFFVDNPRIYSIVRADDREPEQSEIETHLLKMEHVKELVQDIKSNGGLIDQIIVRDSTYDVLEGNSRLAAYRALAKKDAIKWGKIKCILLPVNIADSDVFALLGQYHIKGKKDWAPFEQAGFLYRRNKRHKVSIEILAKDLGIPNSDAKRFIDTYQFMLDHNENEISRWSYYEEYLKSRKIKKLRDQYNNFDDLIIKKIRNGEIKRAVDIRDKLPELSTATKKIRTQFIMGEIKLDDAYQRIGKSGSSDEIFKRIKRFKDWLNDKNTESSILSSKKVVQQKLTLELKRIRTQSISLLRKLDS